MPSLEVEDSCGYYPWLSKREKGSPLEMEKTKKFGGLSEFVPGLVSGMSCGRKQRNVSQRATVLPVAGEEEPCFHPAGISSCDEDDISCLPLKYN